MIFEDDKARLAVGKKQVIKVLSGEGASKLYIAEDCDDDIRKKVESVINIGAQVFYIPTMKELGRMCSIDVGASCAAVKKY